MSAKKKKKSKTEASAPESPEGGLRLSLSNHFGGDPAALPVLQRGFASYQRANLHQAIQGIVGQTGSFELTGAISADDYSSVTLAKLSNPRTSSHFEEGPVEYVDEALPGGLRLSCVKRGLYLFHFEGTPVAVLLDTDRMRMSGNSIQLEIMGASKEAAERFLLLLVREVELGKGLRGGVISLETDCMRETTVTFHHLPAVSRESVILPEAILRQVERQTLDFSTHAERLKAAGRHLKRGILLHGPPGTGKTFTSLYVATQLKAHTTFLLTGSSVPMIEKVVSMARALQPAVVILEDVDLIGTQRDRQSVGANAILFELLNQMDGLAEDTEILFILTTNRPEVLEPALASRPGRIDQAIEIPLPDKECRRKLFALYAQGLTVRSERMEEFLDRTEGVSAAFIKECLRKAAVFASLDQPGEIVVEDRHLDNALVELLVSSGSLTRTLLGAPSA